MFVPALCYIDIKPPMYGQENKIFMNFSQMAIDVGLPNIKVRKNAMWAQKNENIFSTPMFCVAPSINIGTSVAKSVSQKVKIFFMPLS
jgi:hypothetical protein